MPRRSNLFQDILGIVQKHVADNAIVEESVLLEDRLIGAKREVDVVIRSKVAGHELVLAFEAAKMGRPADVKWVEQQIKKHEHLPTDKVVLISDSGFSKNARNLAEKLGAIPLTPEDISEPQPEKKLVGKLKAIWPKTVQLIPERCRIWVRPPGRADPVWFRAATDHGIFLEDGTHVGTVDEYIHARLKFSWPTILEQIDLANITENRDRFFSLTFEGPGAISIGDKKMHLYARFEQKSPTEFHPIEKAELQGHAVIRVNEAQLTHKRLGDVEFSYGETKLGDQNALVVVTEEADGPKLSLRMRNAIAANPSEE
jgi:hypothetical protein